jgi:hypothetical protein
LIFFFYQYPGLSLALQPGLKLANAFGVKVLLLPARKVLLAARGVSSFSPPAA